jgi:hypothetical protein
MPARRLAVPTLCLRPLSRAPLSALIGGALLAVVAACGGEPQPSALEQSLKKTKSLDEIKAKAEADNEMSPEELAEARRKAGFKSTDEIAAENAAMFEKAAREYVKTRMKEYRALVADLRKELDGLEKAASKWSTAKNPDSAYAAFDKGYRERVKAITKRYMKLTGNMAEGGNVQVALGKAVRTFEDLNNDLGPAVAEGPRFAEVLKEIRDGFTAVETQLDEIDKDESLKVNANYDPNKPTPDKDAEG